MSYPPLAQGTQIEGPATQGTGLVRREALPQEFATLGISAFHDEQTGRMTLKTPAELRKRANVLMPVDLVQQVDTNWRPSLRVVQLDPSKDGAHFYPQTGGRLAPRKQALELLADAAGVVEIRTNLSGRERVVVGEVTAETFTHMAVLRIRKSDGTLRTLEASRTYEPFAEYEEIVTSVGSGQYAKKPGTPEFTAEVRKRWLNEIKFAKAKNESKAILRAIRSALQIPHTFSPENAAKPFVVVGFNLSPQDTPEVRQAIAQLYGAAPSAPFEVRDDFGAYELEETVIEADSVEESAPEAILSPPEVAFGDVVEGSGSPRAGEAPHVSPADDSSAGAGGSSESGGVREPTVTVADEQGPEASAIAPAPSLSEPTIPGLEPDAADYLLLTEAESEEVTVFGKTKPPFGTYQTFTMAKVFAAGEAADEWLAYALRSKKPEDAEFHRLLVLACRKHRPELYEAWRAEA